MAKMNKRETKGAAVLGGFGILAVVAIAVLLWRPWEGDDEKDKDGDGGAEGKDDAEEATSWWPFSLWGWS